MPDARAPSEQPDLRPRRRTARVRNAAIGLGAGYLAGSVSFSALLGRWRAPGIDISHAEIEVEQTGETITLGGTTPTSVTHHLGARWGVLAVCLEAGKAALPTFLARRRSHDRAVVAATAFGAVLGHAYPWWKRGGAGYGESPMIGGMAVLDPVGLLVTNALVFGAVRLTGEGRLVIAWPLTLPLWAALRQRPDLLAYSLGVNAVMWSRLIPEMRTSLAGLTRK